MKMKNAGFFVLPFLFDETIFDQMPEHLLVKIEPNSAPRSFTLLDCHDQSQRAKGRLLIQTDGMLQLLRSDGQSFIQHCDGKDQFARDLPAGPVSSALKGFPVLRALIAVGQGEIQTNSLAILDDLQKTQVRGSVWSMSTDVGQVTVVGIEKLRGYERVFAKVCAALAEKAAQDERFEAVYQGLFPDMRPYHAKPDIHLGKNEPSIEVAADIIRTYLAVARQNEEGVIADTDTEFLHDYRVSLRKIRSVISLFKGVFSESQTVELKQLFSELMASTGRMRDLDVYLLEKDMYFKLIPPNLHAGLRAMFEQFQEERGQEFTRLKRRLRSAAYDKTMKDLNAVFDGPSQLEPGKNAQRGAYDYACALIWKRYRKVCKLARSISENTPDDLVHDLRIDCKKLRYLMEFFAPLFDAKDFKTIIKPLKRLQDNLGLFNDFSVQQAALLSFVSRYSTKQGRVDAQIGLAAGGLIAMMNQRQRAERDRVMSSFQQFDGPDIRHLFRSLFHQTEE
ncbi:CHAD domain-containing protein [uncultured Ruegeria sp.]|uniref:CHAD domain-containing protein n=1 Tax=uncultured Ruegeria sp. TaxID=259304 RepID=UPI00260348C3|nr:CHAD domain-containing protein [uncultured Ruegeria sp.]